MFTDAAANIVIASTPAPCSSHPGSRDARVLCCFYVPSALGRCRGLLSPTRGWYRPCVTVPFLAGGLRLRTKDQGKYESSKASWCCQSLGGVISESVIDERAPPLVAPIPTGPLPKGGAPTPMGVCYGISPPVRNSPAVIVLFPLTSIANTSNSYSVSGIRSSWGICTEVTVGGSSTMKSMSSIYGGAPSGGSTGNTLKQVEGYFDPLWTRARSHKAEYIEDECK